MVMQRAVDILLATAFLLMIVNGNGRAEDAPKIIITSPAFAPSEEIPVRYTCDGADDSPPLTWSGIPRGAVALALVVDDPDAPSGTFTHWVVYNISAGSSGFQTNELKDLKTGLDYPQAVNDFGKLGYNGPCPPPGAPHHYHFKLYALKAALALPTNSRAAQVEEAINPQTLGMGEMIAIFGR